MTNIRIKFEAKLKAGIKYDEQANVHIAYAPAIELFSQGETELQAKNALTDAIQSFLLVAYRNNLLEKCLNIAGLFAKTCTTGKQIGDNEEYINVTEEAILEEHKYQDVFEVPASLDLAATGSIKQQVTALAPIPPNVFKDIMVRYGFRVDHDTDYNWTLIKEDAIPPVIVLPKKGELVSVDIMMGTLNKLGINNKDYFDLLKQVEN